MKRLQDVLRLTQQGGDGLSGDRTEGWWKGNEQTEIDPDACPRCGGAGFLRRNLPLGHPDFGRATPCSCVLQESAAERLTRLRRYSNVGALGRYTFETLSIRSYAVPEHRERYERAVETARSFASHPEGWLVLLGESGAGKTHVAAAIANAAIAGGQPALFMVVPDLLDHLRAAFAPDSETASDSLFELVRNAPLLILDDLGAQSSTPWADEKIYQLINHRFNAALPTVFTVGGRFELLDDRLRSRLGDASLARIVRLELEEATTTDGMDPLSLPLLSEMRFSTFNYRPTGPDLTDQTARHLQQAYAIAHNFALNPSGWLVLAGETGSGKTHLAVAVAHEQRQAGRPQMYVAVPDLLDRLRESTYRTKSSSGPDYFERVRGCAFLVLDDLGFHSDTAWAQEKLFQILNHRYNAKLPTVITVRPSDELPTAIRSRLYDDKVSLFFEINAPDYRNPERPRGLPGRRGRQPR
jgi:DNA replication protein DnaC